ncbi:MAG TPA: DUF302 domain-containing protein [Gemmatimonadaceae bacterium]|nr:DUF302 domain-containing protein [Gemmatimonadaceae bacterium]
MVERRSPYGLGAVVPLPFEQALQRTREALADEGFGILCEIDVAGTLRQKLGVDMPPYMILGACNPPLARQALEAEPDIGLLLPCNVAVYGTQNPDESVVVSIDPKAALTLSGAPDLVPIAEKVARKLRTAMDQIVSSEQTAHDSGR